jgi:hypothetical protein
VLTAQTLDSGQRIIQLETAVGSAIKNFLGGIGEFLVSCTIAFSSLLFSSVVFSPCGTSSHLISGINVSRSRFLPVKKSSDLLLVCRA